LREEEKRLKRLVKKTQVIDTQLMEVTTKDVPLMSLEVAEKVEARSIA